MIVMKMMTGKKMKKFSLLIFNLHTLFLTLTLLLKL